MTRLICCLFLLSLLAPAAAAAQVRVVASLPDLGAIAAAVGGERTSVEVLAPTGVDPHNVDPKPNLVLELNRADLLIVNGLGLESSWLDAMVKQARNPKINPGKHGYFDASKHAHLMEVSGPTDRARGDIHPGGNPHFTLDPRSAAAIAGALAKQLAKVDPKGATTYAANARTFASAVEAFAKEAASRFAALPAASRKVVTYHKSLGYLLRWLNLTEIATIEPKPGVPPNPKHVATVLKLMRSTGARVIVQETYYPRKAADTLAKLANARVVSLPATTDVDRGETYLAHMKRLADTLYAAVNKQ